MTTINDCVIVVIVDVVKYQFIVYFHSLREDSIISRVITKTTHI